MEEKIKLIDKEIINMYKYYYKTPVGIMCIKENDGYITEIHVGKDSDTIEEIETKLIRKTHEEIMEYFSKNRYASLARPISFLFFVSNRTDNYFNCIWSIFI